MMNSGNFVSGASFSRNSSSNFGLSEYKVVVLGMATVGKSSVTIRFVNNTFSSEYNPTLQDTFRKSFVLDSLSGCLEILDTAGQEEYLVMQDHWIREGKGFVVVYASNNKESFNEVHQIRKRIERVKNSRDFPMILVGNKFDLDTSRKIDRDSGEDLAKDFNCPFIETSAKTGYNCTEVFMELVREIRKREDIGKNQKKPKNKLKEFFANCTLI